MTVFGKTKRFTSPASFYSIDYPKRWLLTTNETDNNIVNIEPVGGTGAITVSAFGGRAVEEAMLRQIIENVCGTYRVVSQLTSAALNNWQGVRGEYFDETEQRVWLVVGAHRGRVMVLATANDNKDGMQVHRKMYEEALASIVLGAIG